MEGSDRNLERHNDGEELGPPLDADWRDDWEPGENDSPLLDTRLFPPTQERGIAPEPLSMGWRFRHRRRVNLVLALKNGSPILTSAKRYEQYEAARAELSSPDYLFHDEAQQDADALLAQLLVPDCASTRRMTPLIEGSRIYWGEGNQDGQPSELGFIVDHLPTDERELFESALADGKKINIGLVWGPKWKVTRFSDKRIHQFKYSRPESPDERAQAEADRKFLGSNYVVFTTVLLQHNHQGQLQLTEKVLAEANIGTKGGGRPTITRDWGHGPESFQIDRTLPGLISRHEAGDLNLTEEEYLYNQLGYLCDDVGRDDKRWVRQEFIKFAQSQLSPHYQVRQIRQFKFRLNPQGQVVTKDDSYQRQIEYPQPIRINVRQDGYLCNVLEHIAERSHLNRRLDKYRNFQTNVCPVFRAVFQQRGGAGVIEEIMRSEANRKRLLRKSRDHTLSNLAYLLYFLASDEDFKKNPFTPSGIYLAKLIIDGLQAKNDKLQEINSKRYVPLKPADWEAALKKVQRMLRREYFTLSPRASWVEKLSVHGPKRGPYHPWINNQPRYANTRFKRIVKIPKPLRGKRPRSISAFDIYPPVRTLREEQVELARIFIDYTRQIGEAGGMPTTYALFRDNHRRRIRQYHVSGNWIYNRARVLFKDPKTHQEHSSQNAIKALFALTNELLPQESHNQEDQKVLRAQLNYEALCEAAKRAHHLSGRMGEIFTHIALEAGFSQLLNIKHKHLAKHINCKITFENIDRRGHNHVLDVLQQERADSKRIVPDLIVSLADPATGEAAEMLVESKTYIKPVTRIEAQGIVDQYRPHLNTRKLILVLNSTRDNIRDGAYNLLESEGIIVTSAEDVARALEQADPQKYQLPDFVTEESLAQYYLNFVKHPTVFAERGQNHNILKIFEDIATSRAPLFDTGALISQLGK